MPSLPPPRGSISALLIDALGRAPHTLAPIELPPLEAPLEDEDLQLALYLCYELHYRGVPGVDDRWEWNPSLLALRAELEQRFEHALMEVVPFGDEDVPADEVDLALRAIAEQDGPP